jgi:hypothetical protein
MGPLKQCKAEMEAALPKTGPIADLFFEMNQTSAITAAATSYLDVRLRLLPLMRSRAHSLWLPPPSAAALVAMPHGGPACPPI